MDISEGTTTDDLWTPYKELVSVVEGYLAHESGGAPYAVHTFESLLRRHKQTFLSLFKNPAKNPASRDEIKRGITEGVNLPSVGRTLLSKELVDEAIIISDMYNVNEYLALELLHTAQRQSGRHPGLPRGLVAVLLYYDGRRSLLQALKELVMARDGVCWTINAREEIISYVSRYVEQLISDGLLGNVLDALRRYTLQGELELLQNNRALPPQRQHARLVATIENTRKLLAGVVFAASAQRGLDRDIMLRLLSEQTTSPSKGPTGALDEISLALHMALLYALDLSVIHGREDGEELAKKLPLIQDPDLISVLLDELTPNPNQTQGQDEKGGGVRALCQLALGLALAALKRAPQSLLRRPPQDIKPELLDQDEMLVDAAIDGKVFEYLDEAILSTDFVCKEEYYQRRLHNLITDFIVLMHSKLMEMRVKADEAARAVQMYAAEGIVPPAGAGQNRTRLDALLRCVERLYSHDPLGLRHDYWLACTQNASHSASFRTGSRAATLYKFVRLSGELVCAALLPAYLLALASLCVARHTWALLARRDALSAHHLLTALARYHSNLRADPSPFSELAHAASLGASAVTTPAARPGKLLVRQEEVEAMIAALKLIAAVAREDEAACANICENLQWDAVNVMFGLICCHIPIQLKAELCLTLGALGRTAGTAGRVWAALEAARLVGPAARALDHELQEVECRMEEYPLSRAFLTLLDSLCAAAPLPRALGAGARPPGLDPYVQYVLDKLALPAPHRPHAKPTEKWQILSLCFRLFARWLDQYEPSASDFPPPGREPDTNPPPGFRLLLQLHTKSELLRLLLNSLDETQQLLDSQPDGRVYIEQCLISVLQILERALTLERPLVNAASESGRAVLIVGLSKLILAPEGPESQDRLVTCCRVLQHAATLPCACARAVALLLRALQTSSTAARHLLAAVTHRHSLARDISAVALLLRALQTSSTAARHLLAAVTHRHSLARDIRHGFVECLEAEELPDPEEAAASRRAKEGIVALLIQLLPSAPPNFAHFLLGYQLTDLVSRSALHEPGVAGSPRTCLHAILDILDKHIAGHAANERQAGGLVESCYRLVHALAARPATAAPALRLLRARDHWLARHVRAARPLQTASVVTISSRSWVLRACACELGAAAASKQHSALAVLLSQLTQPHRHTQEWEWCLLRKTLEGLPVSVEAAAEPRWELFHAHQLRQAIESCDLPTGLGGKRISVTRVHALLSRELAALQPTAPQRNLVAMEIQKVLDYVTEVNRQRNLAATLTHYYDSWRQLTEILFCVAPHDILNLESRKNLILNILQDLLNKIPPAEVLPQLGNLASGTVLLLLVNLRHCYILQKRDTSLKSSDFETTFFGPSSQIMQTKSLTLKFILHKILSWILVSGGSTQKMRVNLYGALLNYLNIVNLKPSPAEPDEGNDDTTYVSRLDSSKARPSREESCLKSMVIDVIGSFGDNLCAIVCSDCIGAGHDVCRMVALACLDTLIEINPGTDWMNTLINQGYLRSLIDSLLQDDEGLQETLEPNPRSLRVLYMYESKMALLIKMAGSRRGAETVAAQGALRRLAALRVLRAHPDVHARAGAGAGFVPSVATRFRQILVPVLALCDALLTTLGTQNHSCVIHVSHLLLSHLECADVVLRAAHPNSPPELLEEVEAFTSVIGRASNREVFGAVQDDTALQHSAAGIQRVQALMLALLARFTKVPSVSGAQPQPESDTLYYKIVCNLLTYARNIMDTSGTRVILRLSAGSADSADAAPSCGAMLQLLQALLQRLQLHSKLLQSVLHQLHSLPQMTQDGELETVVYGFSNVRSMAPQLLQALLQRLQLHSKLLQSVLHQLHSLPQMTQDGELDTVIYGFSNVRSMAPQLLQALLQRLQLHSKLLQSVLHQLHSLPQMTQDGYSGSRLQLLQALLQRLQLHSKLLQSVLHQLHSLPQMTQDAAPRCGVMLQLLQALLQRLQLHSKLLQSVLHQLHSLPQMTQDGGCYSGSRLQLLQALLQRLQLHSKLLQSVLHQLHSLPQMTQDGELETVVYRMVSWKRWSISSLLGVGYSGSRLQLLQALLQRLQLHSKLLQSVLHQLHSLPQMTQDDMKKLLPQEESSASQWESPAEVRAGAVCSLRARARSRRVSLQRCALALEAALQLLWAHARLYLRLTAPADAATNGDASMTLATAWRGAGGAELPELRKELIAVFNDRFVDQLLETAKSQPPSYRGFMEVILKDIKSMIQFSPL
ncbi:nuclear pore complex protein Nup205 [Amyelois transitella]|uniref:nuclear pore complex protein Nup205 n=1 Tax=Amyelois transitella TaxID=680683 RepID=UPI0029904258|nr:nuclear pore complex protein Nup205 [Amyelois transitella]